MSSLLRTISLAAVAVAPLFVLSAAASTVPVGFTETTVATGLPPSRTARAASAWFR